MDKVKLKLLGISEIMGIEDVALLSLVDEVHKRQLVVTCDQSMRKLIQLHMMSKPKTDLMYIKVLADILTSDEHRQLEVFISDVHDGEFKTEIIDLQTDKHFPIRCSDGILFSIVADVPLYASVNLMLRQSVPFEAGATKVGLPLTILSESMLKESLQKAIDMENYEMASNLRDELKRRQSHNVQDS